MAGQVDALYLFLVLLTTFFSLLIAALILFFAISTEGPGAQSRTDPCSTLLEIVWSVIPLGISMVIFAWGAAIYYHMERAPSNALEIYGRGPNSGCGNSSTWRQR